MPYSDGIIRTQGQYGVSVYDVQQALSSTSNDVGTLCKSDAINKWARYKPIVVANELGHLKYSQIAAAVFGLQKKANTTLYYKSDSVDGTRVGNSLSDLNAVFDGNIQWTYNKPTGRISSPYRLSDFAEPIDDTTSQDLDLTYGYYHATPPPISNVSAMNINLSFIKSCAELTSVSSSSYDGDVDNWVLTDGNATPLYSGFAFRYGEGTQYNVNGADTRCIKLPDLLGVTTDDGWRLAVAVQIPDSSGLSYMRLFTSKYTFYASQGVTNAAQRLMPCMGTNQYACKLILDYASWLTSHSDVINSKTTITDPVFTLPACLCIVKDMYMGRVARDGSSTPYTHCYLKSSSEIYSAPALEFRCDLVVTDNVNFSSSETQAYSYLEISTRATENYAQFGEGTWTRKYINNLRFKQLRAAPANTVVYYNVDYVYITGYVNNDFVKTTGNRPGSYTLGTSTDGSDWINDEPAGGPGLQITAKRESMEPF